MLMQFLVIHNFFCLGNLFRELMALNRNFSFDLGPLYSILVFVNIMEAVFLLN